MKELNVLLKPYWENDTVSGMDLSFSASPDAIELREGEPAIIYNHEGFNGILTFPVYDSLEVFDANGPVEFRVDNASDYMGVLKRKGLYLEKTFEGSLTWRYHAYPRILPEGYRSSPYYDFRNEPFGANGSAFFLFMLPNLADTMAEIKVTLDWDLSQLPKDARGVWSYGEGRVTSVQTLRNIALSFYMVGRIHSWEQPDFTFYWHKEPGFDIPSVAAEVYEIFKYEKAYFRDKDSFFKVFIRRDPFEKSGGGTASPYSFLSGYSAMGGLDVEAWKAVLIHEMTHTWTHMKSDGNENEISDTTWFTEGATEYFSTKIPYSGKLVSPEFTLRQINDKSTRYYANEYRACAEKDLPAIQWVHREAQKLPYGRGFMYLANIDARLRRFGKGGIEDALLGHSMNDPLPLSEWKRFISERLGQDAVSEFEAIMNGAFIEPEQDVFSPEFTAKENEIELNGKPAKSYRWVLK